MPVDKWRTVARRIDKYHGRTYMVGGFIGVILAFFAVFFMGARAEELHVDSGGNFFIVSSPVTSTNNNFITVSVWGTKWNLFIDRWARVMGADEKDLNYAEIKAGHLVTFEGKYSTQYKYLDVKTLKDESVGTPVINPTWPKLLQAPSSVAVVQAVQPAENISVQSAAEPQVVGVSIEKTETAKSPGLLTKYLKIFMWDDEVAYLQKFLIERNYLAAGSATGYFGALTEAAVRSFQKSNGLEPVGAVGPQTREIINNPSQKIIDSSAASSVEPPPSPASSDSAVSEESPSESSFSSGNGFTRYLKPSMSGSEVTRLQEFLVGQGFLSEDSVTGYFGNTTLGALRMFQEEYGIEPTGTLGPVTRAKMNGLLEGGAVSASSPPASESTAPAPGDTGRADEEKSGLTLFLMQGYIGGEVKLLQEFLIAHGYLAQGNATGIFGLLTESAVKEFQLDNGISPVGTVGPQTRAVIHTLLTQ